MHIDIAESIREVLSDKLPVSIPAIGTLSLKHIPAHFGENRQSLLPPSVSLELNPTRIPSSALLENLKLKHGLKEKEATKYIKTFNEKILNAIVNYGKVRINGVGVFSKNSEGEISVVADPTFINAFYNGLPEVKAVVVPKEKVDKTEDKIVPPLPPLPPPPIIESESKLESILKSKKAIEKAHDPNPVFDLPEEPVVKTTNGKGATKEGFVPMEETKPNRVVEPQKSPPLIEEKKAYPKSYIEEKPGCVQPLLYTLGFFLLMMLLFKGCNKLWHVANKGTVTQDKNEIIKGNGLYTDTIDPFENADTSDLTTRDLIPAEELNVLDDRPDKCIIITGTFASSRNVERMKNKIQEKAYEVYTESHGPYTRVGLTFSCADVNLVDYLQDIRKTFDRESWYLDPSLYVPYED